MEMGVVMYMNTLYTELWLHFCDTYAREPTKHAMLQLLWFGEVALCTVVLIVQFVQSPCWLNVLETT